MPTACLSNSFLEFFTNCSGKVDIDFRAPTRLALPLYGYIAPAIILATVVTNCFVVIVLSQRHLRTPTNLILLVMAITEMFTGLSSLPWFVYYYTFQNFRKDLIAGLPEFWCRAFPTFNDFMPAIFHTATMWLTVYLAAQRCIYVCMPHAAQFWCTMARTRCVIICLCIAALLFELPKCLAGYHVYRSGFDTAEVFAVLGNQTTYRWKSSYCIYALADWVVWITPDVFYSVYYWSFAILAHTIPCISLVIFTGILLAHIRRADERRKSSFLPATVTITLDQQTVPSHKPRGRHYSIMKKKNSYSASVSEHESLLITRHRGSLPNGLLVLSNGNSTNQLSLQAIAGSTSQLASGQCRAKRYYHSTTKMLVVVIIVILVIEIPAAVIIVLHVSILDMENTTYVIINSALIVRNVLILLSYPFNFAIYCGMSQQFRYTVNHLLGRQTIGSGPSNGRRYAPSPALFGISTLARQRQSNVLIPVIAEGVSGGATSKRRRSSVLSELVGGLANISEKRKHEYNTKATSFALQSKRDFRRLSEAQLKSQPRKRSLYF